MPNYSKVVTRANAKTAVSTVSMAIESFGRIRTASQNYYRAHFEYSVVISERDSLYYEVHKWLISVLPSERIRALEVASSQYSGHPGYDDVSAEMPRDAKVKPLIIKFNEAFSRSMNIRGHAVKVSLVVPDATSNEGTYREPAPKKISFVAKSYAGQQAIIAQLEEINEHRATARKAVLKMVGQWSGWTTRSDLPPRTMASVSLPVDQKTRVTQDLKTFLESEEKYNRLAIPWHRGYMFHGPPGTGKTSLVKALANEFNLDLWYVSLSDLKAESSLLSLLADVGPRSLLLLEDIDTMKITHDRDGAQQGTISMSSLLNTLDGVATPHGLITVMTTNHFEILDPALTRAGRMDLVELLDFPTLRTLSAMYHHFYGKDMPVKGLGDIDAPLTGISTSQIAEVMKRNMSDARGALVDIKAILAVRSAS